MTRIVAGVAGGRRLAVPSGTDVRPTSDRAREALFSSLAATGGPLDGLAVLDLYAGSGALALEALSRGAGHAQLVERQPRAARAIRENLRALGFAARATLVVDRVERVVAAPAPRRFDVAFLDPPYALPGPAVTGVLAALLAGGWLAPAAMVVLERSARSGEPAWPPGLETASHRRYGEAALWYGRRS